MGDVREVEGDEERVLLVDGVVTVYVGEVGALRWRGQLSDVLEDGEDVIEVHFAVAVGVAVQGGPGLRLGMRGSGLLVESEWRTERGWVSRPR